MSSRDNVSIHQLLSLLESRYAIRVMWALKDGHPQTFRLLQDSVGGITPNTLNTRIKELREAALMTHGSEGYTLTSAGADLMKRMSDLQAFSVKWTNAQAKKAK
jgi:DNA-binding HxlR family transcriptional regulator